MKTGFIILILAGIFQGSFGLGYKKYNPFSWAVFWGVYDIMCIICSLLFALILVPNLFDVFKNGGLNNLIIPVVSGMFWGISAIGFSKGIDKIGMSLVYGVSMGVSTIVGTLTPMMMQSSFPNGKSLILLCVGLFLTLLGVIVVTVAGINRDGGAKRSAIGIILSIFSGFGSGFMNVGFLHCSYLKSVIDDYGISSTGESALKWLPVLVGGCFAGLIYCIFEVSIKKEWKTSVEKGSVLRSIKLFCVSIVWYLALILYGLSTSLLGEFGNTYGWILFNALALIISVFWGLKTGEWKNSKKGLLFIGCIVLIIAWAFIAFV